MTSSQPKRPITDSPWFWLHLFCISALIGLVLVGPKFAQRQANFERKFQGRQRASLQNAGLEPDTPLSTPDKRYVMLSPLMMFAGFGAALSWFLLWRTHFAGGRSGQPKHRESADPHDANGNDNGEKQHAPRPPIRSGKNPMTTFAESPWPGLALGLVLAFAMIVGYFQTGRRALVIGAAMFLLLGLGLAYLERLIETDREQITATIERLADALQDDRDAEVLASIHSGATEIRSRAKAELDRYRFQRVSVKNNLQVNPDSKQPEKFMARFNVVAEIQGYPRSIPRFVELRFAKDGDTWRIDDYSHHPPQQGYMKKLD